MPASFPGTGLAGPRGFPLSLARRVALANRGHRILRRKRDAVPGALGVVVPPVPKHDPACLGQHLHRMRDAVLVHPADLRDAGACRPKLPFFLRHVAQRQVDHRGADGLSPIATAVGRRSGSRAASNLAPSSAEICPSATILRICILSSVDAISVLLVISCSPPGSLCLFLPHSEARWALSRCRLLPSLHPHHPALPQRMAHRAPSFRGVR